MATVWHYWPPLNVTLCGTTMLCGYQVSWLHLVELWGSGFCSLGHLLMPLEGSHEVIHPFLRLSWVLLDKVLNFGVQLIQLGMPEVEFIPYFLEKEMLSQFPWRCHRGSDRLAHGTHLQATMLTDNITDTLVHSHPATICGLNWEPLSNPNHINFSTSEALRDRKTWRVSKGD